MGQWHTQHFAFVTEPENVCGFTGRPPYNRGYFTTPSTELLLYEWSINEYTGIIYAENDAEPNRVR